MKKNIRNKNGITLIALIVTVIVLAITISVTLNLVAGSNGIISKASKATDANIKAQIKEDIELTLSKLQTEYYTSPERLSYGNFQAFWMSKIEPIGEILETSQKAKLMRDEEGILYETKKGKQYDIQVDENTGEIAVGEEITENGTDAKPPVSTVLETTATSIQFKISDGRGHGIAAYAVEDENTAPTVESEDWIAVSGSPKTTTITVSEGLLDNTTYYIFTKDINDNISDATPVTTAIMTYTITYNANGGTGDTGNQIKNKNEDINISVNSFTGANNNEFKEWNTEADGSGTTYIENAVYSENANLELYAIWLPSEGAITQVGIKYGDYINLETNILDSSTTLDGESEEIKSDWRIFYKDGTNGVYAILADYLPVAKLPAGHNLNTSGTYGVYDSFSATNVVNKLNNTTVWKKLLEGTSLENSDNVTVTGGVTLTLWNLSKNSASSTSDGLYFPRTSTFSGCVGYRLTTQINPSSNTFADVVQCTGTTNRYVRADNRTYAIRPVVYLNSNISVEKDANGVWQIR